MVRIKYLWVAIALSNVLSKIVLILHDIFNERNSNMIEGTWNVTPLMYWPYASNNYALPFLVDVSMYLATCACVKGLTRGDKMDAYLTQLIFIHLRIICEITFLCSNLIWIFNNDKNRINVAIITFKICMYKKYKHSHLYMFMLYYILLVYLWHE